MTVNPDPQSASDELRGVLEDCYKLNEHIAEHYILSLSDFRYLNTVSTQIKNALAPPSREEDAAPGYLQYTNYKP